MPEEKCCRHKWAFVLYSNNDELMFEYGICSMAVVVMDYSEEHADFDLYSTH